MPLIFFVTVLGATVGNWVALAAAAAVEVEVAAGEAVDRVGHLFPLLTGVLVRVWYLTYRVYSSNLPT